MTSEVAISCEVHPFAFAAASNYLRYMDHDDCPSYIGGLSSYCTDLSACIGLEFCTGVPGEIEHLLNPLSTHDTYKFPDDASPPRLGPLVVVVRPPVAAVRPPVADFPFAFLPLHGPPAVVVLPLHGPLVVVVRRPVVLVAKILISHSHPSSSFPRRILLTSYLPCTIFLIKFFNNRCHQNVTYFSLNDSLLQFQHVY
ncbi:hypothetical protein NQ318_018309 [Aromia moschata]|uniref:Uncharacterized protein n=1 Tax=Aromia moschata TaxID=1265417 RepID=A0AAV8ZD50_9CUCU|nr:hypothetical protein NQ318_018309 [Aromia moschata]